MLPVCGLDIFEVICSVGVEDFEIFGEDDDRVTNEEVGEMGG